MQSKVNWLDDLKLAHFVRWVGKRTAAFLERVFGPGNFVIEIGACIRN